ncbi:hypothetical protein D3C72_1886920 [compost metagenome]
MLDHLHLVEQLLWIEGLIALHRQTFQRPLAVLALLEADFQAIELQMSDTQLARQHAGPEVRHRTHLIQMQGIGTLTERHIVSQQYRGEAAPAAFQLTDLQRHAQGFGGFAFDFGTVLGHQR